MSGLSFDAIMATAAKAAQPAAAPSGRKPNSAADEFLAYMKKSSAERMQESWLAAHGLSKEKLAAMTPEQREAVLQQMAKELNEQVAQKAREKQEKKPVSL